MSNKFGSMTSESHKINKTADIMQEDDNSGNHSDKLLEAELEKTGKSPAKSQLMPMSPLAASATVINLILATGPFRYYFILL